MIALARHKTFDDLRGGRIGTSSLTEGTRHVAERMLAAHGLAYPADYDFALEGSHVERWKALQAGTIDAALQMIPYDAMAVNAGFTDLGPVTEEFALSAVCARLPAERGIVSAFLQALAEATRWFRDHVEESAAHRRRAHHDRAALRPRRLPEAGRRRRDPAGPAVRSRGSRPPPSGRCGPAARSRPAGRTRSRPPSTTPTCDGQLRRRGRRRRPGRHVAGRRTAPRGSAPGRAGAARAAAAVLQGADPLPAHPGSVRHARPGRPLAGRGHPGAVLALRAAEEPAGLLVPAHPLPVHAVPAAAPHRGTARGAPGRARRALSARARRHRPAPGPGRRGPRRRYAVRSRDPAGRLRGRLRRRLQPGPHRGRDRLRRHPGHLADDPGRRRADRPAAGPGAQPEQPGRRRCT